MQTYDNHNYGDKSPKLTHNASGTARMRPDEVRDAVLNLWQSDYKGIIAFAMMCGATREDAEDATQDAFIEAWLLTSIPGKWEDIRNPSGWIRRIAVRKYWRAHNKTSRELATELTEPLAKDDPTDPSELTVQTQLVRTILGRLDADTRLVMALHVVEGYKAVEIAQVLELDYQKTRDMIRKGRKALKAELSALGELSGREARIGERH
jgi:RNA polymerase sigma factor (sigma-70 family)